MWIWFEILIMNKLPNISQGQLGEAQSFVRAPLSLSGGRQEEFGERRDEAVIGFLIIRQSCVAWSDHHSHVSVRLLGCIGF